MAAILEYNMQLSNHDFDNSNKIIDIENMGKGITFFVLAGVVPEI